MADDHYWLAEWDMPSFRWLDLLRFRTPHHPPPKGPAMSSQLQVKFVACRDYANGDPKSATIALPGLAKWPGFRFRSPKALIPSLCSPRFALRPPQLANRMAGHQSLPIRLLRWPGP
jgi:hypothetical protein